MKDREPRVQITDEELLRQFEEHERVTQQRRQAREEYRKNRGTGVDTEAAYPTPAFLRRGKNPSTPDDFADLVVRKFFQVESVDPEATGSPQRRMKELYMKYKSADVLTETSAGSDAITATPLIRREYSIEGDRFDVDIGIGCAEGKEDELSLFMKFGEDEAFLFPVPENGMRDVPATHGADQLLDWMEEMYPKVHPIPAPKSE